MLHHLKMTKMIRLWSNIMSQQTDKCNKTNFKKRKLSIIIFPIKITIIIETNRLFSTPYFFLITFFFIISNYGLTTVTL